MKLKTKITQKQVNDFAKGYFGTKDNPTELPEEMSQFNTFVVQCALNAGWFAAEFDIGEQDPIEIVSVRKEIQARYLDYAGVSEEAKETEKNS